MTNRIASLRRAAKLSQSALADKMGVTPRTVQRWECGETTIPDSRKLALATLFNCTVGFLMGWEQPNGNGDNGQERVA
ncbi:MAG TPA: helix-turn-helix transcriptional regulator [Solirubrobacteraceae bacterium]|nr:helix-turn-helix transcriptional regulator [Solirubrobacteraceae bacterium]